MNAVWMQRLNDVLGQIRQRQDIVFATFFILIVCMLVLPLPTILVDALIAFNLTLGLLILLTATYLRHALDLSTFPTIVLISTVFRLSLAVSTTRLILAEGHAGEIISGFGNFVVAGNVVVGLVVFFIVAIVQFIVVTKGAERIAEVSARFTLDALPGKQMSIDADLRNGDIDRDEARRRRFTLERESQFFGAMDGAMRFVKGDAIAGFVIVFVNLIGGLIIGVVQRGLSFSEAGHLYSLLTVGDGLVSQIPAMFIAVAAGTVVTRVVTDDSAHLGADIARQLGSEPKAMLLAAAGVMMLGILPGFPTSVFAVIALFLVALALVGFNTARTSVADAAKAKGPGVAGEGAGEGAAAGQEGAPQGEFLRPADRFDVFAVRLNPETYAQLEADGFARIWAGAQQQLMEHLGFQMRELGFAGDPNVPPGLALMEADGVPIRQCVYRPGLYRVTAAPEQVMERGIQPEDISGMEDPQDLRAWVDVEGHEQAIAMGLSSVDALYALAEDFAFEMYVRAGQGFGIAEGTQWLADLEPYMGRLVSDVGQQVPLMRLIDIVRRLLEDQISLRQPRIFFETLLQWAPRENENEKLLDQIRAAMRRQINFAMAAADRVLPVILIEPAVEEALRAQPTGEVRQRLIAAVHSAVLRAHCVGVYPALVVSPPARRFFRNMMHGSNVFVPVLGANELERGFTTHPVEVVDMDGLGLRGARPEMAGA